MLYDYAPKLLKASIFLSINALPTSKVKNHHLLLWNHWHSFPGECKVVMRWFFKQEFGTWAAKFEQHDWCKGTKKTSADLKVFKLKSVYASSLLLLLSPCYNILLLRIRKNQKLWILRVFKVKICSVFRPKLEKIFPRISHNIFLFLAISVLVDFLDLFTKDFKLFFP